MRIVSIKALTLVLLLTALTPTLFGRGLWEIGTSVDRSGFVFIPRVVMNPARLSIEDDNNARWARLNNSFISAAEDLSFAERAMYESQLQEAVRYYIAPKLFFENAEVWNLAKNNRSELGQIYKSAFEIFKEAISQSPLAYISSSTSHFWGMISAGTHIGTTSRQRVYEALENVDPETWKLAKFRNDYPLNRYDIPLKTRTELAYYIFRCTSLLATILGAIVSVVFFFNALSGKRKLDSVAFGWLLLTSWLVGHSLLVALSVYPDPRYIMANFVLQWTILTMGAIRCVPYVQAKYSILNKHQKNFQRENI